MTEGKLQYEIVTPHGLVSRGECDSLTAPAIDGDVGILRGHSPFLAALDTGIIRMKSADSEHVVFVDGGYVEVLDDRVVILAETSEESSKIDVSRAKSALERSGHLLEITGVPASREAPIDRTRARRAQKRAKFRLKAAGAASAN